MSMKTKIIALNSYLRKGNISSRTSYSLVYLSLIFNFHKTGLLLVLHHLCVRSSEHRLDIYSNIISRRIE